MRHRRSTGLPRSADDCDNKVQGAAAEMASGNRARDNSTAGDTAIGEPSPS
jgi:hypothetical protein